MTALASPGTPAARSVLRRLVSLLGLVALLAAWAAFARPESLGGATGYIMVSGRSMEPELRDGDLVITRRQAVYRRGDVIAYRIPEGEVGARAMVIHRVVGGSGAGYVTLGDNRTTEDLWRPGDGDVIGRMVFHVPGAGRWMAVLRSPLPMAAIAAVLVLLFWSPGRGRGAPAPP